MQKMTQNEIYAVVVLLHGNTETQYLNSSDPVEKAKLSECVDDCAMYLQLMPKLTSESLIPALAHTLFQLYDNGSIGRLFLKSKRKDGNTWIYTIRDGQMEKEFDIMIECDSQCVHTGILFDFPEE